MMGNADTVTERIKSIPANVSAACFYTLSLAGAESDELLFQLSGALVDAGVAVHWISFDAINSVCPPGMPVGVRWVRFGEPGLTRLEPRSAPAQAEKLAGVLAYLDPPQLICWGDAAFPSAFLASRVMGTALILFPGRGNGASTRRRGLLNLCLSALAYLCSSRICLPEAMSSGHLPLPCRGKRIVAPRALPVVENHRHRRFGRLAKNLISLLFLALTPSRYRRFKESRRSTAAAAARIFDAAWYASQYGLALPPEQCLPHYLALGQYLRFAPHLLFWSGWYLDQHPMLGTNGQNPWLHYHTAGYKLGCDPNPFFHSRWYQTITGIGKDVDPLLHYLACASQSATNPLFDADWYRAAYPAACGGHVTLLEDYLASDEDSPPHPLFLRHPSLNHDAGGNRLGYKTIFQENLNYRRLSSKVRTCRAVEERRCHVSGGKRFAVCTAITGGYDHPLAVRYRDPDTTYFLLSDRPLEVPPGWDAIIVSPEMAGTPLKRSRYLKMHLFDIIPNAGDFEAIAYIDGNIGLKGALRPFFQAFLDSGRHLGLIPHPMRYCAYQEAAFVLLWNRDDPGNVLNAVAFLEKTKFPDNAGLFEMNFFLARPTPEARTFFADWWNLFESYGNRDQLLAPYVLWNRGLEPFLLLHPPHSVRDHPSFFYQPHA